MFIGIGLVGVITVAIGASIAAAGVVDTPRETKSSLHVVSQDNDIPAGLEGLAWVSVNDEGQIVINTRIAPDDLEAILGPIEDELDGRTVVFEGLSSRTSAEARRIDAELMGDVTRNTGDLGACEELPDPGGHGPRAYLGCDPESGHEFAPGATEATGTAGDLGQIAAAMAEAVVQAASTAPSGASVDPVDVEPVVSLVDGLLGVDFPSQFSAVDDFASSGGGSKISNRLLVTAMSAPGVTSVEFRLEGDCLQFAIATGGDDCPGPISRAELEGEVIK